jgi:hypothetical protein
VRVATRFRLLVLALLLLAPRESAAEWHVKPFLGWALGGETTLHDPDFAVGRRHGLFGVGVVVLGEVFGIEADVALAPAFFESGRPDSLVVASSVTTLTGSVVVAMPRRRTQYTLRPYAVAGAGLIRAQLDDPVRFYEFPVNMAALNVGGGLTGFVTERIGVSWDLRYVRSIRGGLEGVDPRVGGPRLAYWRAGMALTLRY